MQTAIIAENCPDLGLLDPDFGNRRAEPKLPPPPFILEEPEWEYINPAIVNIIRRLYMAGISTLESCQGGPGHRVHFPDFSCDARHDFHAEVLPILESLNLTVLHHRVEYIPGAPLFHKVTLNHWPELPYEHPDERTTMLVRLLLHLGTYIPTTPECRLDTPSDPPQHYGLYDVQPYGDLLMEPAEF